MSQHYVSLPKKHLSLGHRLAMWGSGLALVAVVVGGWVLTTGGLLQTQIQAAKASVADFQAITGKVQTETYPSIVPLIEAKDYLVKTGIPAFQQAVEKQKMLQEASTLFKEKLNSSEYAPKTTTTP